MKTTIKRAAMLSALTIAAATLAGCATQVKSLPLAAAGGESRGGVPVYFGEQNHPAVKTDLGNVSYSVRIARKVAGPDEACREALAEAVGKLRAAARERGANAVIDIGTRFHSSESNSSREFTCGVSPSAAAIAVSGKLVVFEAN
ncbi:YbjQ family protein [Paraburkholderia phenoliruptrix]|uniref:YbjQ family protein n=1 Tax=Paraburkholderia phenoliruptrix TaxID=252970 RepID=UPI001C6E3594|nr:YbjQ family protein [Paraburkholderia phenoliruptrix]MBW9103621.1 signal peptidase [Paraburkholderia phenoliruptrix]MBW9128741.1 signal peptidase [Paraburkholderia ginsengiterrae]